MTTDTTELDAASLRRQLMAADPMKRAMALHAIELESEGTTTHPARRTLAREAADFTARGIPFYAPHDGRFLDWVTRAVSYWERLRALRRAAAEPMSKSLPVAPRA